MPKGKDNLAEGRTYLAKGEWDKASKAFAKAIAQFEKRELDDKDSAVLGDALRKRGYAEARMGQVGPAIELINRAKGIYESLKDKQGLAETYRNLGYAMQLKGEVDDALVNYKLGIRKAEECKDLELVGRMHIEIGNVHHHLRDYRLAEREYRTAIEILVVSDCREELARAYSNLGDTLLKLGDFEESIDILRQSMDMANAVGNTTMKAWAATNMAECFTHIGEIKTAKQYLSQAMDLMETNNDPIGLVYALMAYGRVFIVEKDPVLAIDSLEKGLELSNEMGMSLLSADVLKVLAEAQLQNKERQMGLESLRKALEHFEKMGRWKDASAVRSRIKDISGQ